MLKIYAGLAVVAVAGLLGGTAFVAWQQRARMIRLRIAAVRLWRAVVAILAVRSLWWMKTARPSPTKTCWPSRRWFISAIAFARMSARWMVRAMQKRWIC